MDSTPRLPDAGSSLTFDAYIGIDYSGAETPTSRLKGLQVYDALGGPPQRVIPHPEAGKAHWKWSRGEVAQHLIILAWGGIRFLAGIDHGFSFPFSYFQRYGLTRWDDFLDDFVRHWPTDEPNTYVDFIRDRGTERMGWPNEFRLCERWTSSAKSVFHFDCQGQVAKSTHAGIPWLRHMRRAMGDRIHFWPFDGWDIPAGKSVIAEVYPSILRNRYDREGRSVDEQDAYSVARWLRETCEGGFLERYLDPPLTEAERETAMLEGWILGIG
jgi:hypothetical protein